MDDGKNKSTDLNPITNDQLKKLQDLGVCFGEARPSFQDDVFEKRLVQLRQYKKLVFDADPENHGKPFTLPSTSRDEFRLRDGSSITVMVRAGPQNVEYFFSNLLLTVSGVLSLSPSLFTSTEIIGTVPLAKETKVRAQDSASRCPSQAA